MTFTYVENIAPTHAFCRIVSMAGVLALFVCATTPQCIGANAHQRYAAGVYLTHDEHVLHALARRVPGIYRIDGYRMIISKQTEVCWHDVPLQFGPELNWAAQPVPKLERTSPCESAPPHTLLGSAWLQYLGTQEYQPDIFRPSLTVVTTRLDVWESGNNEDLASHPGGTGKAAWQVLCASADPRELRYPNEGSIQVVCDANANTYVEKVFSVLLRGSEMSSDAPTMRRVVPTFHIVKPFRVTHDYDFEAIDGREANCNEYGGGCSYKRPRTSSTVQEIVYAADGAILIPDTALAHLENEAELAALLSYTLVATDQQLIRNLFRVQHLKKNAWTLSYAASGRQNSDWIGQFILNANEQVLRLGVPRMYSAGYDIRYAPLSWAVEQGKHTTNPLMVPDFRRLPWYATYAFNDIGQLYPNVDYSKLKSGEKEYQQFLQELRRADPAAFAAKRQAGKP